MNAPIPEGDAVATCGGKVRHPSRKLAERALRNQLQCLDLVGKDREPMAVYCCEACGGGWHVGRNYDTDARRAERKARKRRNVRNRAVDDTEDAA